MKWINIGLVVLILSSIGYHHFNIEKQQLRLKDFKLPAISENKIFQVNQNLFKNSATVLHAWSSRCQACIHDHQLLQQLIVANTQDKIQWVGLNYRDQPHHSKRWLAQYTDPFKLHIIDQQGILGIQLGLQGTPQTWIIDSKGTVHYQKIGQLSLVDWQQNMQPILSQLITSELS